MFTPRKMMPSPHLSTSERNLSRSELSDRRWKRRRCVEHATILRILFELLYKNHPQLLLDFVDMASKSIFEGASKDEATVQDLQV